MAYPDNFDDWNPMSESYHDANFDLYENGPCSSLTPFHKTPETEYKLYVNNIPLELTQEGVTQLFNTHGKTLSVMRPSNSDWAFVAYGSFREAEMAIRRLDNKSPLYLKVQFSKSDEQRSARRSAAQHRIPGVELGGYNFQRMEQECREYVSPLDDRPPIPRQMIHGTGRAKELAALARRGLDRAPGLCEETDDRLYPVTTDPYMYNPYDDEPPFANTNNMFAKTVLKISNDGTRYVTNGRGFTWYELPPRHPNVHRQIRTVHEKRMTGLYQYGENKLAPQIQKCQNCFQPATMRCQRCQGSYCSRSCQEIDWPRHKIECESAIPPLEGTYVDAYSLSVSSGDEPPSQDNRVKSVRRLRRPYKTDETSGALPNSSSTPVPETSAKKPVTSVSPRNQRDQKEGEQIALRSTIDFNGQIISERRTEQNDNLPKPMNAGDEQAEAVNATEKSDSSTGLPKQENQIRQNKTGGDTQDADLTSRKLFDEGDDKKLEVENTERVTARMKMMKLNTETTKPPVQKPHLADPDVSFHRAGDLPVTSGSKSAPKVAFANFANSAEAPATPEVFAPVRNAVGKQTPPRVSASKKGPRNIVELLDKEEEGCFEVHVLLGSNKAAVTVCVLKLQEEYAKISKALKPACEAMPPNTNFAPKIGDFVCGKRLDDWIRGTVVSLGPPVRLAAVDEGRVEPVDAARPIPQGFSNFPMLGAICDFAEGDFKLEQMAQYMFVVTNNVSNDAKKDRVEIVVFSPDYKEIRATFEPWIPAPEQKGTPYATLKSNTEVCLVSFRSHTRLFARSLLPKELETFKRVTQEVAKWSTKVTKPREPPVVGEMLLAKYAEDGNFYRAIVRQIRDKNITVSYLDFGNIETTTVDNLRPISDRLKEYPSCVANIVLRNVPADVPMNKEVNEYLGLLAGEEKPLICTFEGSPVKEGVELKCPDGTSVNEKIIELLTPSWKKKKKEEEEDKTTAFMLADLEVAELGTKGAGASVLVLFAYSPLMYAMAPYDLELIGHVTEVMAAQMAEYCAQTKEHYIPRQEELCLAPFENTWYRAVCLQPNTNPTTSTVNFIDFGNVEEIPHKDLRLITKDFTSAKTIANICQVVGLGPVNEEGDLPPAIAERVAQLVSVNSPATIKIVECTKPGEYVIELPEVRDVLIKEGLLEL